jgi:hypothetical protein
MKGERGLTKGYIGLSQVEIYSWRSRGKESKAKTGRWAQRGKERDDRGR